MKYHWQIQDSSSGMPIFPKPLSLYFDKIFRNLHEIEENSVLRGAHFHWMRPNPPVGFSRALFCFTFTKTWITREFFGLAATMK